MLQKKICVLGGPAVGKTSLVSRFAKNFFTDRYLSTIGVKIEKKTHICEGEPVTLLIWDLAGADEIEGAAVGFLRGAAGYIVAIDGTRSGTVGQAERLQHTAELLLGPVPFVVALNKCDMAGFQSEAGELSAHGVPLLRVSAKTGAGVESLFDTLVRAMLGKAERDDRERFRHPSP
jgi:small GTP-binding protein